MFYRVSRRTASFSSGLPREPTYETEPCFRAKKGPETVRGKPSAANNVGQVLHGGFELELEISNNYCIYRWAVFSLSKTRLSNPWAAKPIFVQFAIIFGVYARLETLYAHMTFARFAQGLAALYH